MQPEHKTIPVGCNRIDGIETVVIIHEEAAKKKLTNTILYMNFLPNTKGMQGTGHIIFIHDRPKV